ncbi:MAG TPA: T9SS type A sorting domain-containing protein, partial [Puia sp.]
QPASTDAGKIYFRIRRKDGQGNISFSIVKGINLEQGDQRPGIQIYPNPVDRHVTVLFDERQTGAFRLELISTTGQIIQQKQVQMAGNSVASMELAGHPARGVYLLRAQDLGGNRMFLTKVIVD